MSNKPFTKKDVMEEYLSSLLTEDVEHNEPLEHVSKLLDSASPLHRVDTAQSVTEPQEWQAKPNTIEREYIPAEQPIEQIADREVQSLTPSNAVQGLENHQDEQQVNPLKDNHELTKNSAELSQDMGMYTEPFQSLIFEVAGLSLALPLTELGGIHQLSEVTPIFGKPNWFKGVMLHRDEKMKVVDTAMWVMPDKCNEKLADSAKNQYLIMLDDSGWGLACERIIDTITLQPDDVKWRKYDGKRTWLSGMVKKKMCALVNVKQLIRLLQQGMNSNDN